MKTVILLLLILFGLNNQNSFAQTDPAYDSIAALNLNYFADKPIDSLLIALPQSYNDIGIWGVLSKNKARGLDIRYPNGMTITILPRNFIYMNPIDSNRIWNLTLFKKETASYISIWHPWLNSLTGQYP